MFLDEAKRCFDTVYEFLSDHQSKIQNEVQGAATSSQVSKFPVHFPACPAAQPAGSSFECFIFILFLLSVPACEFLVTLPHMTLIKLKDFLVKH